MTDVVKIISAGQPTIIKVTTPGPRGAPGPASTTPGPPGPPGPPGTGEGSGPVAWDDVTDKPATFPHDPIAYADVTGKPTTVAAAGLTDAVTLDGAETLENKEIINPGSVFVVLTDAAAPGGTVAWNANLSQNAFLPRTQTGVSEIGLPTNPKEGCWYTLHVIQPAGGSKDYSFATGWNLGTITKSTAGNARDVFYAQWDGARMVGFQIGNITGAPAPAPAPSVAGVGTNLSGMEWAAAPIRYGTSNMQNLNFTPPRTAEIAALAAQGMTVFRLPVSWELLQPILHDSNANATVRAAYAVGVGSFAVGDFYKPYADIITGVLDACEAAGVKCLLDLHNYFRYQDFVYEGDGSVVGFVNPSNQQLQPYTSDGSKVQSRIAATAGGATLTIANYTNFWEKAATKWGGHAGLLGYGLMNEPNNMPAIGGTVTGYPEDGTISSDFQQAAITAIRAIDATTPIYYSGNNYTFAATIGEGSINPDLPLTGTNLVCEVHMYLDANNNGAFFDYDNEVAKNQSAGLTPYSQPIGPLTAYNRIKKAVDWAAANGVTIALTEVGQPIDDVRWQTMFDNAVAYAQAAGCSIFSWMGGSHWAARNYAINHIPDWYQNRMVPPLVEASLRKAVGLSGGPLFDTGDGFVTAGGSASIQVWGRGYFPAAINVTVSSNNGGAFSKTTLTLGPGLNPSDNLLFTPNSNVITTISYARADAGQVPPPRKVYSLTDPVGYEATSLAEAANCILAKYSASRFLASDAYTDYFNNGAAAASAGNITRAIADSGWGTRFENIQSMINWFNTDAFMQSGDDWILPTTGVSGGKRFIDQESYNTRGFWCKKVPPDMNGAGSQPNPKNRTLFDLNDSFFQLAACTVNHTAVNGVAVESSRTDNFAHASLRFNNAVPRMEFADGGGTTSAFPSSAGGVAANTPMVLGMTSVPGAQKLYVDNVQRATGALTFAADPFNGHFMGFGWFSFYPGETHWGKHYGVIYGKGAITTAEFGVLSRYMATLY